jgi:hypothetical protein
LATEFLMDSEVTDVIPAEELTLIVRGYQASLWSLRSVGFLRAAKSESFQRPGGWLVTG